MKKSFKKILLVCMVMSTMLILGSCGAEDDKVEAPPAPEKTATEKEAFKGDMISLDDARLIALKDSKFEENQVIFGKSAFDGEDNLYEIAFYRGTKQYDYEIDKNGKILTNEATALDQEYVSGATPKQTEDGVTEKVIRENVLKDAKLKSSEVMFTGIESAMENNKLVYTVTFISVDSKATAKVDGTSGEIITMSVIKG